MEKARCDAEGQSFDGLLALATGCIVESGEVLARMIPSSSRRRRPRGVVPLELQLLEPDHLDSSRDDSDDDAAQRAFARGDVSIRASSTIINGKRKGLLDSSGASRRARPRDADGVDQGIDAADMLHVYRKDRIGQGRGVPWCAPVMLKGRDVADLEEAVVVKARIEACLAAFIKTNDTARTLAAQKVETARRRRRGASRQFSPGMIAYLDQGEEVQTASRRRRHRSSRRCCKATWLTLAAGAGITYDQLTGDLRRANFRRCAPARSSFGA
jgi:capsid protein